MRDTVGIAAAFRTEWPRLVATLVRDLQDLDLAEDVAQEAFLAAATAWERDGTPSRPGAWLLTAARRRAIDRIRRDLRYADRIATLGRSIAVDATRLGQAGSSTDHDLVDDQLALLCGCCHPALALDAQVALTLRAVAGLSTEQIARAFLVSPSTMEKRLVRAKHKVRAANIPFRTPDRDTLVERLAAICHVIHLIFTEGHTSASDTALVRGDLCDEALWLADLVVELVPDDSEVLGLAALIHLTDARRATRADEHGVPILLEHQDRSRWNQQRIATGLALLGRAHASGTPGPYTLRATLAALHTTAPSFAATNWAAIVGVYDALALIDTSPVVALNRAIAVSYCDGPEAGLAALDDLGDALDGYHYAASARGEFLLRLDRPTEAAAAFQTALAECKNDAEAAHLRQRLAAADALAESRSEKPDDYRRRQ